jgi:hypothetical protein
MKLIFGIVSLICLVLAHTLAQPVDGDSNVQLTDSRFIIPAVNCLAHCMQPQGKESESDENGSRGFFDNLATAADCIKKCTSRN